MVFLMKMVFAIELLKHTNNQYGIVQLQNLRIRVTNAVANLESQGKSFVTLPSAAQHAHGLQSHLPRLYPSGSSSNS